MTNPYTQYLSTPVPQGEQEDSRQVQNNAGGFTFTVSDKDRLERFLVLGTDGGTFNVQERDLTKQNVNYLIELIKRDPAMVINTTAEISRAGRAYRNSPAIFVLALLFKHGSEEAKSIARSIFSDVVRTSTHLFEFAQYVELLGGWGRAKRAAVASWYTGKTPESLAYQAVKYRQRNGWTHRDLFRLSHPVGVDSGIGNFILGKSLAGTRPTEIVIGFSEIQASENVTQALNVLNGFPNLPWEAIPTQFLKEPEVWKKLFYNGQLKGQALVRNITRLARIGAFADMQFSSDYASRLVDEEMIAKTRLHPINFLNAVVVHQEGQLDRKGYYLDRKKDWNTVPVIVDALNEGFHLAFKHTEPANKRTFIGLDVSGSMSSPALGLDMSCAMVVAAMAMTVARTEPMYQVYGFSDGGDHYNWRSSVLKDIGITPKMDLNTIMKKTADVNMGATDCSLPMKFALNNKVKVDTFLIYTDNETWYGDVHPHIALRNYRDKMGIDAKLVVAGVTATDFTIADPTDRGMLDVVGFDSGAPRVIADFSAGRI